MHHKVSGDYDFNTGLLRTFTNQNGNSSTYLYDNIARITSGSFADGGQLVFNYPDANTVEKKQLQSAGTWIDQFVYFDGLGRKKQTQLKDPEGDDFTDTTYDAGGELLWSRIRIDQRLPQLMGRQQRPMTPLFASPALRVRLEPSRKHATATQ